jgi:hypothetical protein
MLARRWSSVPAFDGQLPPTGVSIIPSHQFCHSSQAVRRGTSSIARLDGATELAGAMTLARFKGAGRFRAREPVALYRDAVSRRKTSGVSVARRLTTSARSRRWSSTYRDVARDNLHVEKQCVPALITAVDV